MPEVFDTRENKYRYYYGTRETRPGETKRQSRGRDTFVKNNRTYYFTKNSLQAGMMGSTGGGARTRKALGL